MTVKYYLAKSKVIINTLLLTMIDGKVCNALTDTRYTQKCYISGATPKMMSGELKG